MIEPILKISGVSKVFGTLQASKNISLVLRAGEIHALIGPNGAGKSTLIKQIVGEITPDSGSIELLGVDVTHHSIAARSRHGLARTFQVSALTMEDTALQNVLLGVIGSRGRPFRPFGKALSHSSLRAEAENALTRVGLLGQAATRTSELSHGQRRQLEVAVALALKPRAFVMDEPMAGLGTEGSQKMTAFLRDLKTEAPILMVEHDMDAVFALADRISVLVYGEIIATGTVAEIRSDSRVQRAYLGEDA